MIEINRISKSFRQNEQNIPILKDLSLTISNGSLIGILGQSGSGKSTFLSLMAGIDRPDSGQIIINQTDTSFFSEDEWTSFRAKNISIVFQQYHLISHLTALENIMLPLEIIGTKRSEAKSNALALLESVGLENRANHFPNQLSGGENQRVAIGRALITKPRLLLADEPSGNLDQETGSKVMTLFFDLVRKYNTTTLLVTHNELLAEKCDSIYKLNQGRFFKYDPKTSS